MYTLYSNSDGFRKYYTIFDIDRSMEGFVFLLNELEYDKDKDLSIYDEKLCSKFSYYSKCEHGGVSWEEYYNLVPEFSSEHISEIQEYIKDLLFIEELKKWILH